MKIIKLSNGGEAFIDEEDYPDLINFTWRTLNLKKINLKYAVCYKKIDKYKYDQGLLMHRVIMGLEKGDGKQIDHINGDGLDNRKSNLRLCDYSQNQQNRQSIANKLGFKGVTLHPKKKDANKYSSKIRKSGKCYSLGYYETPQEAALAYNEKAKELFGEFAYLNII